MYKKCARWPTYSRKPVAEAEEPVSPAGAPIVLLHGFWHGSWCWSEVAVELAARGRYSVAVDMAGHGLHARRPAAARVDPFDPRLFATESSALAGTSPPDAAGLPGSPGRQASSTGPPAVVRPPATDAPGSPPAPAG